MNYNTLKNFLIASIFLWCNSSGAQVSMKTNLLHTIALNKALTFEVRLTKGAIAGYSKFQVQVPDGVVLKEVENKEGTFEFEENKAKLIWVVTPADCVISVRMKLAPVRKKLEGHIVFKYYYMSDDNKREFESVPFNIKFKDTSLPVFMSAPMTELQSKDAPEIPLARVDTALVAAKGPGEVSQQVQQLKRDSKEAYKVGEREKRAAMARLDSLNTLEKTVRETGEASEKEQALKQIQEERVKVNEQIAIAERVLTLAKTLEDQANEIERINNGTASSKRKNTKADKKEPAVTAVTQITRSNAAEQPRASSAFSAPGKVAEQGLVYKLQLGAFKEKPQLDAYKSFPDLILVSENEVFKVLVGSYTSRDQATQRRIELQKQSLDCFIVAYRNGVRVK